jgi:uncharacterized protein YejL (UPF0352 family)
MALTDAIGGVVSGLLNQGTVAAPDLSELFRTIDNAGENQRALISALPADLQKQYADYKASNAAAGTALQTGVSTLGQNLQAQTAANYDPNAPAVKAAEDQAKTAIYADLPGQQDAIREALAATGGFDRGTASKQLAAPVIQAGAKYAQAVSGITTQQLQAKQAATQDALKTVTSMNDQTLQQLFGMSQQQALQILQGNRQDLKDQLTSLINQSQAQTQQTLGVQGADITNQYNKAVADKAQQDALNNSFVNLGTSAISSMPGFMSGLSPSGSTSAPANYNPGGSYNQTVAGLGY